MYVIRLNIYCVIIWNTNHKCKITSGIVESFFVPLIKNNKFFVSRQATYWFYIISELGFLLDNSTVRIACSIRLGCKNLCMEKLFKRMPYEFGDCWFKYSTVKSFSMKNIIGCMIDGDRSYVISVCSKKFIF